METRKKINALRHENSPACVAFEYSLPTDEIDSAVIELNGRYPESGWAVNTACTALIHVIRGTGRVCGEAGDILLEKDDQLLICPDEKYALEGDMKLLFSASPAWSPEQARTID